MVLKCAKMGWNCVFKEKVLYGTIKPFRENVEPYIANVLSIFYI